MKKLLYLSAGSRRWGIGHLCRSCELIDILRAKGIDLDAVALVQDIDEARKSLPFFKQYDRLVSSLDEIGPVDASGIVVDVNDDFQSKLQLLEFQVRKMQKFLDMYH